MGEVNDQDKLDEDEEEPSGEAKIHPNLAECSVRNPECSNHAGNDDQILDPPESVLNASPGVLGALDVDHDDAHQDEEQRHDQVEPVDCLVAHAFLAVNEGHGVVDIHQPANIDPQIVFRGLAERNTGQTVLDVRGEHDAADNGGEEEEDGVHHPGGDAAVAATWATLTDGTGCRAKTAGSSAPEGNDGPHHFTKLNLSAKNNYYI